MKVYSDQHPGPVTDLGNGTYYENSNIEELVHEETGQPYYSYDVELHTWPTDPVVPVEVYAWRLRRATQLAGIKSTIDNLIDQMQEPEKGTAYEAWHSGVTIRRDSILLGQLVSVMELTSEQVDELFIQANLIPA